MSHDIMEHDKVGIVGSIGWHGLGKYWDTAKTPQEALIALDMDKTEEQWPVYCTDGEGNRIAIEGKVANVCKETKVVHGIVSEDWHLVQVRDLAEFCTDLAQEGDVVKVETAGSIRNGAKFWFLLRGDSFSVRQDTVVPYFCVASGFDGCTAVTGTGTSVKVICKNTLGLVIPIDKGDKVKLAKFQFSFKHTGDVKGKIEEARKALGLYVKAVNQTRVIIDQLAARDVSREEIQQFFLECYTRDFGSIAMTPINKQEERKKNRSQDAFLAFADRFDRERDVNGPTAWNAVNAYTGWLQNDQGHKKHKEWSKLDGLDADRSLKTLELGYQLVNA